MILIVYGFLELLGVARSFKVVHFLLQFEFRSKNQYCAGRLRWYTIVYIVIAKLKRTNSDAIGHKMTSSSLPYTKNLIPSRIS